MPKKKLFSTNRFSTFHASPFRSLRLFDGELDLGEGLLVVDVDVVEDHRLEEEKFAGEELRLLTFDQRRQL